MSRRQRQPRAATVSFLTVVLWGVVWVSSSAVFVWAIGGGIRG